MYYISIPIPHMQNLYCIRKTNKIEEMSTVVHHYSCELESGSWRCVLETTLFDKVCQWLVAGVRFSPDIPVSSSSKTDRQDKTKIML